MRPRWDDLSPLSPSPSQYCSHPSSHNSNEVLFRLSRPFPLFTSLNHIEYLPYQSYPHLFLSTYHPCSLSSFLSDNTHIRETKRRSYSMSISHFLTYLSCSFLPPLNPDSTSLSWVVAPLSLLPFSLSIRMFLLTHVYWISRGNSLVLFQISSLFSSFDCSFCLVFRYPSLLLPFDLNHCLYYHPLSSSLASPLLPLSIEWHTNQ